MREHAPDPAVGESQRHPAVNGVHRLPPTSYFTVSAVFHYLGPSLAVLLFAHVAVVGVAWLRLASAAAVFAVWRRPWRLLGRLTWSQLRTLVGLGVVLAVMNSVFYLAVDRLPLSTVGAIEFLGTVYLAVAGARTRRNLLALVLTVGGVVALTEVRLVDAPLGFVYAFANCAGFMLYVVLGHRIANTAPRTGTDHEDPGTDTFGGIDQLGAAMLTAAAAAAPFELPSALPAFSHPSWLLWGVGVGVCSSVIPYVADQLAMARLPRATFALMLALLPATATAVGLLVLQQVPTAWDLLGVGLVILGVAAHQPAPASETNRHRTDSRAKSRRSRG
ncbi:MAG: EamA family transporter [Nocardioidaceae bacterium]